MELTIEDHIGNALDNLNNKNMSRFKHKLCNRKGTPCVKKNAVENVKYNSELVDLLVDTFTINDAVPVVLEVLRSISCNQVALDLEKATGGGHPAPQPSGGGSSLPDISAMKIPSNPMFNQEKSRPEPQTVLQGDSESTTPRTPVSAAVRSGLPFTSGRLIHSTPQFKQETILENQKEMYKILDKGSRKRLALIINNVEFDRKNLRRNGAEKDQENMEKLLRGLDYELVIHKNLSGDEMDEAVRTFAERKEHEESDSTFVVIMSHGKKGFILGVHHGKNNPNDVLPVDNIYKHFNTENCPAMVNKPKVILIQACRGSGDGGRWVADSEVEEPLNLESDDVLMHQEKDFTSLLSCTPDTKAYRDPVNGALFIGFLVEVFNDHAHKHHVEELFRRVMRRFEDFGSNEVKQMVCKERGTLPRFFYLFPGL